MFTDPWFIEQSTDLQIPPSSQEVRLPEARLVMLHKEIWAIFSGYTKKKKGSKEECQYAD